MVKFNGAYCLNTEGVAAMLKAMSEVAARQAPVLLTLQKAVKSWVANNGF